MLTDDLRRTGCKSSEKRERERERETMSYDNLGAFSFGIIAIGSTGGANIRPQSEANKSQDQIETSM